MISKLKINNNKLIFIFNIVYEISIFGVNIQKKKKRRKQKQRRDLILKLRFMFLLNIYTVICISYLINNFEKENE